MSRWLATGQSGRKRLLKDYVGKDDLGVPGTSHVRIISDAGVGVLEIDSCKMTDLEQGNVMGLHIQDRKTSSRTVDCDPSAPTTYCALTTAPSWKLTSSPCALGASLIPTALRFRKTVTPFEASFASEICSNTCWDIITMKGNAVSLRSCAMSISTSLLIPPRNVNLET